MNPQLVLLFFLILLLKPPKILLFNSKIPPTVQQAVNVPTRLPQQLKRTQHIVTTSTTACTTSVSQLTVPTRRKYALPPYQETTSAFLNPTNSSITTSTSPNGTFSQAGRPTSSPNHSRKAQPTSVLVFSPTHPLPIALKKTLDRS